MALAAKAPASRYIRSENLRTVGADHQRHQDLRRFLHEQFANGPVLDAAPQLLFQQFVDFIEFFEHQLAVVVRLHVAVRRTANEHEPIGFGIDRKVKVGPTEVQNALATVPAFVTGPLEHLKEVFQNVHPGGKEQLFLIPVMMGQQPESHARTLGNLLERGFGIAAFAKKLFGGLQQGLLLGHGHTFPPKS